MRNFIRSVRLFNRDVHLLLFTWGMIGFAYFGIRGVILNLFLLRIDYTPEFIGIVNGIGLLAWAISAIPAGIIGARWGLRTAITLGITISLVGFALTPLIVFLPATLQPGWLIGWTIFTWVGAAMIIVNSNPYLMHVTDPRERPFAFAAQGMTMAFMGFFGSLIAGVAPGLFASWTGSNLQQPQPYWYILWLIPLAYVGALIAMMNARQVLLPKAASVDNQPLKAPVFLILFFGLLTFLTAYGDGTNLAFMNIYLDDGLRVSTSQIGLLLGVSQLLGIFIGIFIPSMIGRWGALRTFWLASIGSIISLALIGLASQILGVIAGYLFISVMSAIIGTSRGLSSQEAVRPAWSTAISASLTIGLALGWAVASFFGAYLLSIWGYRSIFLAAAGLSLLGSILLWIYMQFGAGRSESSEALST